MAVHLDLRVTVEGVESREQLAMLTAAGCHHAQGYLLGRPDRVTDQPSPATASPSVPGRR